ncbi:ribosomal maturation YjgA family protein [Hamadaea tsunoensis]|uniref:ribosomal maturation YjgA family protein n=1 Tax=Hamadaea tsunoensis TaxID=53368 RepID=UPI0007E8E657|nr:DUF2809 domain-containing protein [Hamadaea tsunoensis]
MRTRAVVAMVVVTVAGLAVRAVFSGAFAKYAGDALYAADIYALVVFSGPHWRPVRSGAIALAFCWVVEFFQLTVYPAELSEHSLLARLVLGSTFNPPDLFWYAVGIALLGALDYLTRPRGLSGPAGIGGASSRSPS